MTHYDNSKIRFVNQIPVRGKLQISGVPSVTVTTLSTYTLSISSSNSSTCESVTTITKFKLKPLNIISASSASPTLNQEICFGSNVESITLLLTGSANGYIEEWEPYKPDGIDTDLPFGSSTITISGLINSNSTTTTIFKYKYIATGEVCPVDSERGGVITGTIVVQPPQKLITGEASGQEFCVSNDLNLEYLFEGIQPLTVVSTNTLNLIGLDREYSYTSTPSIELTVVSTATFINEFYQFEIVQGNGVIGGLYNFISVTGTESISTIVSSITSQINSDPLALVTAEATTSSTLIIKAKRQDYFFWIRINNQNTQGTIESIDNTRISITDAVPIKGKLSLTGVPSITITSLKTYTLTISTQGSTGCDSTTFSTEFGLKPLQYVNLSSSSTTLDQSICPNSNLDDITFLLSGSATRYSISWSPSTPDWINVNQPAGSSTITLSGTSPDNISSTESYTYVITAQGDECIADPSKGGVVTGTITITPGQYINKSNAADLNQTICDNSLPIDPIQFTLTGSSD